MRSLQMIEKTAAQWGVPNAMPELLHALCAERAPGQAEPAGTWPGKACGVRPPEPDETLLSAGEVQTGANFGLLRDPFDDVDQWPVTQLWRPVGSWEKRRAALLAKPTHWDGLAR